MKKYECIGDNILEIRSWWGWREPGCTGFILTDQKRLYQYQKYNDYPKKAQDKNYNFFTEIKTLNDKEYAQVIKWIQKNIINKKFEIKFSRDAGSSIFIKYKNQEYKIINYRDLYIEIKKLLKGEM